MRVELLLVPLGDAGSTARDLAEPLRPGALFRMAATEGEDFSDSLSSAIRMNLFSPVSTQ